MLLQRLGKRTKDDPQLRQLFLERRRHGHAVKDRIDRDAGEPLLLQQGDAELLVSFEQLGVYLVEALQPFSACLWRRVVNEVLVVDWRIVTLAHSGSASNFSSFSQ